MLQYCRFQVCNLSNYYKLSGSFYKALTLERYSHRQGIFDDDDDSSNFDRQTSYRDSKTRHFDRNYNNKSNFSNFRQNRYDDDYDTQNSHRVSKQGISDRTMNYKSNFNNFRQNRFDDKNFFNNNQNQRFTPNQFHRSRVSEIFGQELVDAKFDEKDLIPIEKYFYVEHPNVAQRSIEEVQSYRNNLSMSVVGTDIPNPITDFEEFCLPDSLKKVIENQEYTKPTPIQSQGWPIALSGRDMVGISQTGSGKTLVFMIPAIIHALNQSDLKPKDMECAPQILVLAPTRELVQQIYQVSTKFCDASKLIGTCVYGGASKNMQLKCLEGAHICIATPGRLIDFISEGQVNMKKCTYLVLDEADRMLDMGFEPQIRKIIGQIRPDRQTLMWSATWPRDIQNLAEDFLKDYVKVTVGDGQLVANPNIEQNIYVMEELDKENRLISLLQDLSSKQKSKVLIFAQTKKMVSYLGMVLNQSGIKSLVIHGDVSQTKRDYVLDYFRKKNCVLIATDVAARGLDVTDVHDVINYDFPANIEDYIHRIGRTARGSASGVAHSFVTLENAGIVSDLISVLNQAKQTVNPELLSLAKQKMRARGNFMKPMYRQRYQQAY